MGCRSRSATPTRDEQRRHDLPPSRQHYPGARVDRARASGGEFAGPQAGIFFVVVHGWAFFSMPTCSHVHGPDHVNTRAQLSLAFEPGLTAKFRSVEDCLQHVVLTARGGVDAVAVKIDMAPSELTRRLHAHLAAKEGDPNNRPLRVSDMVHIITATGDLTPLYWLAEKFAADPESQRTSAMQQLAMLAPVFINLAEQAGIQLAVPTKRRR